MCVCVIFVFEENINSLGGNHSCNVISLFCKKILSFFYPEILKWVA